MTTKDINIKSRYRLIKKVSLATLIAIYVLILVGGIVRSSGSGMGCPDWPKCFGNYIPPTDASELPSDYKEIYSAKRAKKNIKFAKYLSAIGFDESAQKILDDASILHESDFNKYRTWTEYVNRLVGVTIGFLILATFIVSLKFWKTDPPIFVCALSSLILVVFQAWTGSIVVSTNLVPWTITFHMLLAIVIVALLAYIVNKTSNEGLNISRGKGIIEFVLIMCLILSLVQIILGTQVRENVDVVASSFDYKERNLWIENLGVDFIIHRSFSWVVLILHVLLFIQLRKNAALSKLSYGLFSVVFIAIVSGVTMAYLGIPAFVQPIHLLLGTLIFGIQFLLFLKIRSNNTDKLQYDS